MKKTFCAALVCAVMGMSAAARAEEFFRDLGDIPLMPGLEEIESESILFDKPEGRVAWAVAVSAADGDPAALAKFYADTLPQLGWRAAGPGVFTRQGERLNVTARTVVGKLYLTLSLAPAPAP